MSEISVDAEYHFRVGNFMSAKSEYEQILSEKSDLRSRTHCENKISECSKLHKEVISSSGLGESQFPLIHETKEIASIVTLKVSSVHTGRAFNVNTEKVFKAVSSYLNSFIEKASSRFCILDWHLEDLEIGLKQVSRNQESISDIKGDSLELAAGLALLSFLIGKKIDPMYVFTGSLLDESGSVRLGPVDNYRTKIKFAQIERPELKGFFVPPGSGIGDESVVEECGSFGEVVSRVFPDFANNLMSKLDEWNAEPSERGLPKLIKWTKTEGTVISSRDRTLCNLPVTIFVVEHPKIFYSELKQVFGFFKNKLGFEIKESRAAVVLDGVKSNFLTALLMGSDHLKNPPNIKFISVLKPFDDTAVHPEDKEKVSKDTEAIIVRYDNHKDKEGEVFYFRKK